MGLRFLCAMMMMMMVVVREWYKYQLSLIDPRLYHAVDRAWRSPVINYSGRASELGGIVNLVDDDGPVYHALSVHHCRAKSIARFKSGVFDKVPEGSALVWRYPNFLLIQPKTSSIHSPVSIELRLVTDRQTETDRRRAVAITHANIALCG